jgi:DNA-binding GntR family transcriptional regulator
MIVHVEMIAQEHADIVAALREHDVERSVAAVERHITNAYGRYVRLSANLDLGSPVGRAIG